MGRRRHSAGGGGGKGDPKREVYGEKWERKRSLWEVEDWEDGGNLWAAEWTGLYLTSLETIYGGSGIMRPEVDFFNPPSL